MFRNVFIAIVASLLFFSLIWMYDTLYFDGNRKTLYVAKRIQVEGYFDEIAKVEDSYEGLEDRFEKKLKDFDKLKNTIPNRNEFIKIFDQIRRLAETHKVKLVSLNPILDDSFPNIKDNLKLTTKHIERIPVQIQCSGKYLNIGEFIDDVTNLRYLVNIGRATISTDMDFGGQINCELVLFAYRFIEEKN